MLFHGPTRETAEARTNAVKKLGEDFEKHEGEWSWKVEIRTRKKFLAVREVCVALLWPTPSFKERTLSALGSQQRETNSASTVPNYGIVWREALQTDSAPQEALQTVSGQRYYKLTMGWGIQTDWAKELQTLGRSTTDSGPRHYEQTLGRGTTHWLWAEALHTDFGPRHYTLTLGRGTTNWLWAEALQTDSGKRHYRPTPVRGTTNWL